MTRNEKIDPALARAVNNLIEDLFVQLEAAEFGPEADANLPKLSKATEEALLRGIEAELDRYYPPKAAAAARVSRGAEPVAAAGRQVKAWLRIAEDAVMSLLAELLPQPGEFGMAASSRSRLNGMTEPPRGERLRRPREQIVADLTGHDVDVDSLEMMEWLPIELDHRGEDRHVLIFQRYGPGRTPAAPEVEVTLDGVPLSAEVRSPTPLVPKFSVRWTSGPVRLRGVGRTADGVLVVELSSAG